MDCTICDTCQALVYSERYEWHMSWHEDLRDFIRATANGEA